MHTLTEATLSTIATYENAYLALTAPGDKHIAISHQQAYACHAQGDPQSTTQQKETKIQNTALQCQLLKGYDHACMQTMHGPAMAINTCLLLKHTT